MKNLLVVFSFAFVALFNACSDDGGDFVTPGNGNGGSEYDADVGTLHDLRDGQTYATVTIGGRVWMAENLNYETETSVVFPEYNGKSHEKYGRLYAWEDAKKACPSDWRLPGEDDWTTLVDYAGGTKVAGGKLKATTAWDEKGNYSAGTDDYGFAALPGGVALDRSETRGEGRLSIINSGAFFWSSAEIDDDEAYTLNLRYENDTTGWFENRKNTLISVRCIKD